MRIRPASSGDAAAVLSIYAPIVRDTATSFEDDVPSLEDITDRIRTSIAWLVCDDGGSVLGYGYAGPFHPRSAYRWSVEVSVYVAPEHQRRGIGRLLLEALLTALRERGFVNAFAGVALPNAASVALFEAFGFKRIALQERVGYKLGRWRDVGWWQLCLEDPEDPPSEPQR